MPKDKKELKADFRKFFTEQSASTDGDVQPEYVRVAAIEIEFDLMDYKITTKGVDGGLDAFDIKRIVDDNYSKLPSRIQKKILNIEESGAGVKVTVKTDGTGTKDKRAIENAVEALNILFAQTDKVDINFSVSSNYTVLDY